MPKVGLFVTCLVDALRPQIGFAAARLLEQTGAEAVYPPTQTCCGQIALSSGYRKEARALIEKCADEFADCEAVVIPSGSCCATFRNGIADLFETPSARIAALQGKCLELSEYLQQADYAPEKISPPSTPVVTWHDSCSGLRELGIKHFPRQLLERRGYSLVEMADCEECCGFGGRFSIQMGDISVAMADRKCDHAIASGATAVVAGDWGCLMHLQGRASRRGLPLAFHHWAELLVATTG